MKATPRRASEYRWPVHVSLGFGILLNLAGPAVPAAFAGFCPLRSILDELNPDRPPLNWLGPGRFQTRAGVIAEAGLERFASFEMPWGDHVSRFDAKVLSIRMNSNTGIPEVLVRFRDGGERILTPKEAGTGRTSQQSFEAFTAIDGVAKGDDHVTVNANPWASTTNRIIMSSVSAREAVMVRGEDGRPIWVLRDHARQAGIGPDGPWILKTREEAARDAQVRAHGEARTSKAAPPPEPKAAPVPKSEPKFVSVMDPWDVGARMQYIPEADAVPIELMPGGPVYYVRKIHAEQVSVDGELKWQVKRKPGSKSPPNGGPAKAQPKPPVAKAPPPAQPPAPKPEFARIISFEAWSAKYNSADQTAWARTVLGVESGTPPDIVKKAYRKLVSETHPDRNPGDLLAPGRFDAVVKAFNVLK